MNPGVGIYPKDDFLCCFASPADPNEEAPPASWGPRLPSQGQQAKVIYEELKAWSQTHLSFLSCVLFFVTHPDTISKQQKKKKKSYFWKERKKKKKQFKQPLQKTQLQLKGLTPGWGVKSIFVISLSILISGLRRTGWCLCVYCATVGFPYFGGPLVSVWSPCMHSYCLNENTDTG